MKNYPNLMRRNNLNNMAFGEEFDSIALLAELLVIGSVVAGIVYIIRSVVKKRRHS